MPDNNDTRTVSAFQHENDLMHFSLANKRMLIALVTVCVTFIITIVVFVHGYTVREKNWLDMLSHMNNPGMTEVAADDGVHEQPNP